MSIIDLGDDTITIMVKMAKGNPGAVTALIVLFDNTTEIDPDNAFGPFGGIILLDTFGIYGTDIYVLYNDICARQIHLMLAVLRAGQLGIISSSVIKDAASRQDRTGKTLINAQGLYDKVKEQLPNFDSGRK